MAKPTEDEVRAIISGRLTEALADHTSLMSDRTKALDMYYGRPLGNEIDGRSQVVTKDLMDVIEWMMPSLMRVFCTKDSVQFDAVGPEDDDLAKQETLYVSHVLWKKNPGFMLIYDWIKDALMQKVGYVAYWWEDEEKVCYEEYSGLTDEQLVLTLTSLDEQGETVVVGHEQDEKGHNIKVRIKKKYGCAKIEVIPGEEIIVDSKCRGSIKKARFVGRLRRMERSDVIQMGYTRKRVKDLTDYTFDKTSEALARDTVDENTDRENGDATTVVLLDCYTYIDKDDDGIDELRHYLMGGNDTLEDDEAPEIQIDSWTPTPVPHRHVGLSEYDLMEDLVRINTALNRGLLDNVYFTNNVRHVYDKNTVDVASLQINRPGGHVANNGPPGLSIMPMPVNPMAGQILPVIDYIAQVRETRTGVGRMTSGVDANVLAQSTKGAYTDAKSAANQRIEAIARIFAETGLSSLYGSLHRLLSRHQDWEARFKLKDQWVTVNPTEWQERANMTVSVGLGNANHDEVRQNLALMAQAQTQAAQMPGLIQPNNVYALFKRLQSELGFEQDDFITDPKSPEYQQFMASQKQPPNPLAEAEMIKSQTTLQGKQLDAAVKTRGQDMEYGLGVAQLELSTGVDLAKAGLGAELELRSAQTQGNRGGTATQQ